MPVIPSSLLEPIWSEFEVLLIEHYGGPPPEFDPAHPLGCHRRRISDRVVFDHVVEAMVHGSGYERIATRGCSDRTIRRRLADWAEAGLAEKLHALVLAAYDKMIGLDLDDLTGDGCITKAPCGGEKAGPSPVDRRKGGLKRSSGTDGAGVPLGLVSAGANRHDAPLLDPTLTQMEQQTGGLPEGARMHLDSGYDGQPSRDVLAAHELAGEIVPKGERTPVQFGRRWVGERTHSWMNGFGKLRRCTEKNGKVVDFYLYLAAAFVTLRRLIQEARVRYRWVSRPTTRRLR